MRFPVYDEWVSTVLNPRDRKGGGSPWCFETKEWHAAYAYKHAIARMLRPTSILELGVRYGYSAHAFLSAANVHYIGVDINDPKFNAMGEPTVGWASAMLQRTIMAPELTFIIMDTQSEDIREGVPPADLVHVDADHTFEGATRDLERAWELTRQAMLVDDFIRIPAVHDATDAFAAAHGIQILTATTNEGDALLLK